MQNEQQGSVDSNQPEPHQKNRKTAKAAHDSSSPTADGSKPALTEAIEDPKTEEIVDNIMASESDELLEAHDEKLAEAFSNDQEPNWLQKVKDFLVRWWQNPTARWSTIAGFLAFVFLLVAIPPSRYFMLNNLGVRSKVSLNILDESTQQPLKNVQISLAAQSALTNKDGSVVLEHIKLGSTQLNIEKRGFATITQKVIVGWGSNPLGTLKLTPQGTQFDFNVIDFLSTKPIVKAEATSGDASALSDSRGIIKLTIDKPGDEVQASIKADGYREEKLTFSSSVKDAQTVKLVPSHQPTFVTKRSGKFDLYKIDADGKNEKLLLAGTGYERDDITLVPHPTLGTVAMVSTREDKHNTDGYLLSTLTLVNTDDSSTVKLAQSERIQIIGWVGNRLVYVQVAAGSSAANPKRNRLVSYDYDNKSAKELASTNYFNDIQIAGSKIYYAPSSVYQSAGSTGLYKIDADGANKQTIVSDEVWNIFRTSYDHLVLSMQGQWDDYQISSNKVTKLSAPPGSPANRVYIDSPDGKHSTWIDSRDGKGVLLAYDPSSGKDATLHSQNGLTNPVNWLSNNTLVYRVNNGQETADYVLNIEGGDAKKLRDVTNTTGVDRWYYY